MTKPFLPPHDIFRNEPGWNGVTDSTEGAAFRPLAATLRKSWLAGLRRVPHVSLYTGPDAWTTFCKSPQNTLILP
jgi:hypothetical protein